MSQTRTGSMVESCLNTATGFVLALLTWQFIVCPLYNIPMHMDENLGITSIFTVISVARSYLWRRYFNGRITRTTVNNE